MQLHNGDLLLQVYSDIEQYTVAEIAQIACSTLRVATASKLPFRTEALLRAQQFEDGLYVLDKDDRSAVRFVKGLSESALGIFQRGQACGVPLILSEENLIAHTLRTWLVLPLTGDYRLVEEAKVDGKRDTAGQAQSGRS